jgi:hypothetical protein
LSLSTAQLLRRLIVPLAIELAGNVCLLSQPVSHMSANIKR